jgi:choline dehydrogenase-like flavoprotein
MKSFKSSLAIVAAASVLLTAVSALPRELRTANIFRRADDIREEYDYIIAGAGTAGLTVADRLTADGKTTVLVVEYCHVGPSRRNILACPMASFLAPNLPKADGNCSLGRRHPPRRRALLQRPRHPLQHHLGAPAAHARPRAVRLGGVLRRRQLGHQRHGHGPGHEERV